VQGSSPPAFGRRRSPCAPSRVRRRPRRPRYCPLPGHGLHLVLLLLLLPLPLLGGLPHREIGVVRAARVRCGDDAAMPPPLPDPRFATVALAAKVKEYWSECLIEVSPDRPFPKTEQRVEVTGLRADGASLATRPARHSCALARSMVNRPACELQSSQEAYGAKERLRSCICWLRVCDW